MAKSQSKREIKKEYPLVNTQKGYSVHYVQSRLVLVDVIECRFSVKDCDIT